jgi:hypothetical protein
MSLVSGPAAIPCSVCLMQFLNCYRYLSGAVLPYLCHSLSCRCLLCMSNTYSFPIHNFFTTIHFSVLICSTILMLVPLYISRFFVFRGSVTSGYPASSDLSFYYYIVSPFLISEIQVIIYPTPFFSVLCIHAVVLNSSVPVHLFLVLFSYLSVSSVSTYLFLLV